MLKAVQGRYRDGELILDEEVPEGVEARAILYFPVADRPQRRSYRDFGGRIPREEVEAMARVIEEDCERIDLSTW